MKSKKAYLISALLFVVINLVSFCLFYIPNFVLAETTEWVEYTRTFVNKFFEFLLPTVAGVILFLGYREVGLKKTLVRGIFLSLPRAVYLIPYYYLYYWIYGNDSVESISLSALVTLFGLAVFYGQVLLLFLFIRTFARLPVLKKLKEELPLAYREKMPKDVKSALNKKSDLEVLSSLSDKDYFNFSSPSTLGIFAAAFVTFGLNFLRECIDTVQYLIEYAGNYYLEEIIYITACYLFLLIELLVSHVICCKIRNVMNNEIKETKTNGINETLG